MKWIKQPLKVGHAVDCPPPVDQGRAQLLKAQCGNHRLLTRGVRSGIPNEKIGGEPRGHPINGDMWD